MAASKYLALAVLVLLANSIPTLAVLPQLCQHVSQLNPQDAQFCMKAGSLRELGCLCGSSSEALMKFQPCFQLSLTNDALCTSPSLAEIIGKYAVSYAPGAVALPGFGVMHVSALFKSAPGQINQDIGSISALAIEVADSRPVLDLSSLPEGIPFPLDLDESSTGEVMVTQGMDGNGELAINIDVNIPRSFLSNGGELDFDINNIDDDFEITVDSELDLDVTLGLDNGLASTVGIGSGESGTLGINILPSLDAGLPRFEGEMADDVTVEMDIEMNGDSQIRDAIITVRDEDASHPISGQEVGLLLTEISGWLAGTLQSGQGMLSHEQRMPGALRGVSKLLADVGEQIGEIMPDQSLYRGQTLEIIAEEAAEPQAAAFPAKVSPCMLTALAEAARSVMTARRAEEMAMRETSCRICAFVNEHLALLWCIVVIGASYIVYTLLASLYQYLRPSPLDLPECELDEPLILHAADFVDQSSLKMSTWEPYCGPIKGQSSNQQ